MSFKPLLLVLFYFKFFISCWLQDVKIFLSKCHEGYKSRKFSEHIIFISFLNLLPEKITFQSERSFFENICFSNFSLSLNTCFCIDVCGLVCAFRTNTTIRNQKKLSDSCFKLLLMHTMRNFSGYVALYWQVGLLHSSLSNALHVFLFSSRYHSLSILVPSRQHRLQLCMYIPGSFAWKIIAC